MRENFISLNTAWGKPPQGNENVGDHIPLTWPQQEYRGKHKKLTLVEQDADPAASADQLELYSKSDNGTTELYYRRNGDASGNKLTSGGSVSVNGLVLRAFVIFDFQGKILKTERLDADGNPFDLAMSYNVTDVVPTEPFPEDVNVYPSWNINFTNALDTDNYFWNVQSFNNTSYSILTSRTVQVQPYNSGTYGDTVTANRFRVVGYNIWNGSAFSLQPPPFFRYDKIMFEAYTVA